MVLPEHLGDRRGPELGVVVPETLVVDGVDGLSSVTPELGDGIVEAVADDEGDVLSTELARQLAGAREQLERDAPRPPVGQLDD